MSVRAAILAALLLSGPAAARTLLVGDGRPYPLPSDALAAAVDGDTVSIAPGQYFDCAIVRANDLTIQGEPGDRPAAITDKVCEEKALLVLRGNHATVRDLTLQRARVPDGNGAGIRLEAPDLTVDRVRFVNDQVGILSGSGGGTIAVTDSTFRGGGVGGERPKFALMIGRAASLGIVGCTFDGVKGGQVSSAADRTAIVGTTLGVGAGDAEEFPTYAVLVTAGVLSMENDVITVGPLPPRPGAAIGVWDDASAIIRRNRLVNDGGTPIALVKDWSWGTPSLADNTIGPADTLLSSSGIWRHRASEQFYYRKAEAHDLASGAKQTLKRWLGR